MVVGEEVEGEGNKSGRVSAAMSAELRGPASKGGRWR